jgi:hypothetical protein
MGQITLIVPRWQVDSAREPQHQYANETTRAALKERLLSGDYRCLTEAGEVNPELKEAIITIIGSRDLGETEETEMTDGDFVIGKRRAGLELIVSLVTRLRNQNVYNFLAAVLSILVLGNRVCPP